MPTNGPPELGRRSAVRQVHAAVGNRLPLSLDSVVGDGQVLAGIGEHVHPDVDADLPDEDIVFLRQLAHVADVGMLHQTCYVRVHRHLLRVLGRRESGATWAYGWWTSGR